VITRQVENGLELLRQNLELSSSQQPGQKKSKKKQKIILTFFT